MMRYNRVFLTIILLTLIILTCIPKLPNVSGSSSDTLTITGTVYDYNTRQPIENAYVVYYIVFKNEQTHMGYPIDCAYTDSSGHYTITLTDGEQQLNSAKVYSLDEIKNNGFMLVVYKEGYLRSYVTYNIYQCIYHQWQPGETSRIINIGMYSSLPVKEYSKGNVKARYYYSYMQPAAMYLVDAIDKYYNMLKERFGIDLLNKEIVLEFYMGEYVDKAGEAQFGLYEPNRIYINWFPWITDPKNKNIEILIIHELVHLFQKRLNNDGMIVRMSGAWISEGQAVAVSKALAAELNIEDGKSFYEQATDPNVDIPSTFEEYFMKAPDNYPRWGKLFSKIVVEYKRDGESEWDFIKRFMQYYEEFAKSGCVGEYYLKSYKLMDYEIVLLLSFAACKNLTDVFLNEYNFPSDLLIKQKNAYWKFLEARYCLSTLSQSDPVYSTYKNYYDNGVDSCSFGNYDQAIQNFTKALSLVNCTPIIMDPIRLRCIAEAISLYIKVRNKFRELLEKYVILLDGEKIIPEKPIPCSEGRHKIEVFYKGVKIYDEYVFVGPGRNEIIIALSENLLTIDLGEAEGGAYIEVYLEGKLVEKYSSRENVVKIPLPSANYTIVVYSGGERRTFKINLNKDTELSFRRERETGTNAELTISLYDTHGNLLKAILFIDDERYLIDGRITVNLKTGKHLVRVMINNTIVYEEYVNVEYPRTMEKITIELYKLNIQVRQKPIRLYHCILSIYDTDENLLISREVKDYAVFTLPLGIYIVNLKCDGYQEQRVLEVSSDYGILFEVRVLPSPIYLVLIVALFVIILAFILLKLFRK